MSSLTNQEIDLLIAAVKSWTNEDVSSALSVGIIGGLMSNSKEEVEERMNRLMNEAKKKQANKEKMGIMLQSKLILMKERNNAN